MANSFYPVSIPFRHQGQNETFDFSGFAGDMKVKVNLQTLFERKRGALFYVNQEGYLKEVGWRKWLSYVWNEQEEREKVRTVIDHTLEQLNVFVSQHQNQRVAHLAVRYLFDKEGDRGIGRLGQALYNRQLVRSHNALSKALLPENTIRLKLGEKFVDLSDPEINGEVGDRFISFDLGDPVSNKNLYKLLVRKPGQKYQVGDEKRRSQEVVNEQVQQVVTDVIKRLNDHLERHHEISRVHQLAIKQIFSPTSPLNRLKQKVFNRGAIAEGSRLEQILSPNLSGKREALAKALLNIRDNHDTKTAKRAVEKAFMDLVFEEFQFVQKLGIDLERNGDGGSGGARYARNRFGRKILVVKPGDEGPHGVNNPQWYARFKRWVISPKACLEGNSEPMAEVDSWLCDRSFDLWSVPPTEIRYVESADFVGSPHKECSLQMFVEGCGTLGEYVDVSPSLHSMPRPFLRWYCGSSNDTGFFSSFEQRTQRRQDLLARVPKESLERVSLHNFLIEDVDCHFENILVKDSAPASEESVLSRVFSGDTSVTDADIRAFVESLFTLKGNQALLDQLLFSEIVEVDGVQKKITLVKHDGGSSNPHHHPSAWDYLSIRFKHLFEALPHFEEPFSEEIRASFVGKQEALKWFLCKKAKRELRNILGVRDLTEEGQQPVTKHVFDIFWDNVAHKDLFYHFILEKDPTRAYGLRLELITELAKAAGATPEHGPAYLFYFNYHLKRIHGNIQTRLESYQVLSGHLQSPDKPMRTLFKDVRSQADFERELKLTNEHEV